MPRRKKQTSPLSSALAALATFAVLVWIGIGVKAVMMNRATRQMAVAPSSSRPALDRNAETSRAVPGAYKKAVTK
jgi:hypothetical protein